MRERGGRRARRRRATASSARATGATACDRSSAASAAASPTCSRSPTATRCCSATAARPCSGTPPRSASSSARSTHLVIGEFSSKFAAVTRAAPHLDDPAGAARSRPGADRRRLDTVDGRRLRVPAQRDVDRRDRPAAPPGRRRRARRRRRHVGRGRHARRRPTQFDVYYFAPQKCFASDGGLWLACCSPRAIERIEQLARAAAGRRRRSTSSIALENSRLDQTYNTPALATLFLARPPAPVDARATAGSSWRPALRRRRPASSTAGPTPHAYATPFVTDPALPQPRDRDDRLRRRRSTRPRSPPRSAPTASSTSSRTASSAATSCGSRCSPRSSPTTSTLTDAIDFIIERLGT